MTKNFVDEKIMNLEQLVLCCKFPSLDYKNNFKIKTAENADKQC